MLAAILVGQLLATAIGPCDTLPQALVAVVHRNWPRAWIARPTAADSIPHGYVDSMNQTDGNPFCVTGDFDGNGRRDFALLIQDSLGARIFAFHRIGATYVPHLAYNTAAPHERLQGSLSGIGLFRVPPTEHADMYGEGRPLKARHDAFEAVEYEISSWTMVWDGRRYRTFWTSD
jgi:hypothetical protein